MASEFAALNQQKEDLIQEILSYDNHGRRVYLIGSAEFGPVNEPIKVKSTVGLHNKFGKRGTLINAFHAFKYVNRDAELYLVKTTGEHSMAYLNVNVYMGDIIEDGFVLVASQANEIFDDIEVTFDYEGMSISFPKALNKPNVRYEYKDYPTVELLSAKMNDDVKKKVSFLQAYYSVEPGTPTKHAFTSVNPTTVYLHGGECGLEYSKNLLYNCLDKTYQILESLDIDFVIPVDAFLDDIYPNDSEEELSEYDMKYYHSYKDYLTGDTFGNKRSYMDQLLQFCLLQLNSGVVTTGVMGFNTYHKDWSRYLGESDDLKYMYKACLEYNLANCQNPYYSFMINCVAGDIEYNYGTITDNGYLAYAALCSSINLTVSATNKPVDNIAIFEEFEEDTLREMADTGIACFRHSPLYDKPVVYDAVTPSQHEGFHMQCNVRQIQLAISYLNKLYQFYIGWNMHRLIEEGIFERDTDTILKTIRNAGIINDYEFRIFPYYHEGHIIVLLVLKTLYMTKSVTIAETVNVEFIEDDI